MSLFDRFLSTNSNAVPWKELKTISDLEQALERSYEVPVALFKHSISCGISAMVKSQLEAEWDLEGQEIEIYYLDLINHRDVSNLIADKLGVWHQSPQVILVKDGQAVYNASHQAIRVSRIKSELAKG